MEDTFNILSIDGGGIRGIIPAKYLQRVEEILNGTLIHEYFDLITGTSTGGIIALAAGMGIPMKEICDLYAEKGKQIFSRNYFRGYPIIQSKYNSIKLKKELNSIFEERKMSDYKTRLCIPSINITNGRTKVFKTPHDPSYIQDKDRYLYEIALATSAAPLYFKPYEIESTGTHVDGGLWANNPALVGITEAIKLGYTLSNIKICSLGTGFMRFDEHRIWTRFSGFLGWRTNIVDLTFLSQSQSTNFACQYLNLHSYERIDYDFSNRVALDDTKKIKKLLQYGEDLFVTSFMRIKPMFFNEIRK